MALPAPDRFSKNIFLLSGCAIFPTAFQCVSTWGEKHTGPGDGVELCSKMNEGQWPFVLSCHRASATLSFSPVPQLFVDLHRLTLRGVTDVGNSQPDTEARNFVRHAANAKGRKYISGQSRIPENSTVVRQTGDWEKEFVAATQPNFYYNRHLLIIQGSCWP